MIFLFVGGMILSREPISTAIVKIFSEDPEVIGMAANFLSIMAFWCFINGVYNSTMGLFQGTGHIRLPWRWTPPDFGYFGLPPCLFVRTCCRRMCTATGSLFIWLGFVYGGAPIGAPWYLYFSWAESNIKIIN